MNIDIVIASITLSAISVIAGAMVVQKVRHVFRVAEGYAGLLYHNGKFIEALGAGRHVRWGRNFAVSLQDVRKAFMFVAGQEVLTADNIGLKASLFVTYQVTDPAKAVRETQNWLGDVYNAAQLALRSVVGGIAVEELLKKRLDFGKEFLARVQPEAEKVGVTVFAVEMKDVMFPADLKRAFADVLKAKQEGQAALERARGESAALRNLANAARVLDGNPALMNLRLVQSLTAAQGAGNTLVFGMPGGFVPLKAGKNAAKTETESEE